jgi:hypothetical protein
MVGPLGANAVHAVDIHFVIVGEGFHVIKEVRQGEITAACDVTCGIFRRGAHIYNAAGGRGFFGMLVQLRQADGIHMGLLSLL